MGGYDRLAMLYDMGVQAGKPIPNMVRRGNIDVNHRPIITNADGSKSSIYSVTVPIDKDGNPAEWDSPQVSGYALVPSIANGKFLTPTGKMPTTEKGNQELESAATRYYGQTRQHLGVFNSAGAADEYAALNHDYVNDGTQRQVYSPSPSLRASVNYTQQNVTAQPSPQVSAPISIPDNLRMLLSLK